MSTLKKIVPIDSAIPVLRTIILKTCSASNGSYGIGGVGRCTVTFTLIFFHSEFFAVLSVFKRKQRCSWPRSPGRGFAFSHRSNHSRPTHVCRSLRVGHHL